MHSSTSFTGTYLGYSERYIYIYILQCITNVIVCHYTISYNMCDWLLCTLLCILRCKLYMRVKPEHVTNSKVDSQLLTIHLEHYLIEKMT